MQKEYKVKCIDAKYDINNDMMIWRLYFLDKKAERTFAYPANDLKKALNITKEVGPDSWHFFCDKIKDKEFNFVMEEDNE
jgi:hypothetical protein